MTTYKIFRLVITCIAILTIIASCKKFVEIDPPRTDMVKASVFTSDATAKAAMSDIYTQMNNAGFANGDRSSLTYLASLTADEMVFYTGNINLEIQEFNDNAITPINYYITSLWSGPYKCIYKVNAIIEAVPVADGLSAAVKKQLEGEAKFIRAFCHFYLVNMFGDIPLALTTDYRINASLPRTATGQVYEQIIKDLQDAQALLGDDYSFSQDKRARPNKWAAIALLARVYLYAEDWINAELQATAVINNTSAYNLVDNLTDVFLANSTEAIWQLANQTLYTRDNVAFSIFSTPVSNGALRKSWLDAFEPGDRRRTEWIDSISDGTLYYYFPEKYKALEQAGREEYSMILRLAEQYLIRAEARTMQGNITGANSAAADLNIIRNRASLGSTTAATEQDMLLAIEQERKAELFTEWGHRWFDLKRTKRADAVLQPLKTTWQSTDALYPIPEIQLLNDGAMRDAQNPGY